MRSSSVVWTLLATVGACVGLALATPSPAAACMQCECYIEDGGWTYCGPCDSVPFLTNLGDKAGFDKVLVEFAETDREKPDKAVISVYGYSTTSIRNGFT